MSSRSHSRNVIVQMKIKLCGVSKPPVWRRLRLRADTRLDHLHEISVEDVLDPDPELHYPSWSAPKVPAHPKTAAASGAMPS